MAMQFAVACLSFVSKPSPRYVPAAAAAAAVVRSTIRAVEVGPATRPFGEVDLAKLRADGSQVEYSVDVPYREAAYDPAAASTFFRARPLASLGRFAKLARLSGGFVTSLVLDRLLKREEEEATVDA
eukprot:1499888-Prymnesium_polylepis.1